MVAQRRGTDERSGSEWRSRLYGRPADEARWRVERGGRESQKLPFPLEDAPSAATMLSESEEGLVVNDFRVQSECEVNRPRRRLLPI